MADIIGVRFKEGGKLYYFKPNDEYLLCGQKVIVETARGLECGEVVMERRSIPDAQISHELRSVIRAATDDDIRRVEENHRKEEAAFPICEQRIAAHKLDMKLVSVEYAFDGSKILFCFTADGRVDFRDLVRDLAGVFHARIELRQIGVRDEAKMLGGLGICGRPFCCTTFLGDFVPVSIKMAKEQGLSLNPTKISGSCGRLMCCLKYEEDAYEYLNKHTPRQGARVQTSEGKGTVADVSLLTGKLKLRMDSAPDSVPVTVHKRHVKVLTGEYGAEVVDERFQPEEPYSDIPKTEEVKYDSLFSGMQISGDGVGTPSIQQEPRRENRGGRGGRGGRGRGQNGQGNQNNNNNRGQGQNQQNNRGGQSGQNGQNNNQNRQNNQSSRGQNGQNNRNGQNQQNNRGQNGQNQQNRQNNQNNQNRRNGQTGQGGQGQPGQGGQGQPGQGQNQQNNRNNQSNRNNQNRQGGQAGQNGQTGQGGGQHRGHRGGQHRGGHSGQGGQNNSQNRQNGQNQNNRGQNGQNKPSGE